MSDPLIKKDSLKESQTSVIATGAMFLQRFRRSLLPWWQLQSQAPCVADRGRPDCPAQMAQLHVHSRTPVSDYPPSTSEEAQSLTRINASHAIEELPEAREWKGAPWMEHAAGLTQAAERFAPRCSDSWSIQIKLNQELIPDCSLQLSASDSLLVLRFRTLDAISLALLCQQEAALARLLQSRLPQRTFRIDVLNEHSSNVTSS